MSVDFYRIFEEKHRGSRELIKSRLRVYLPFIEPLDDLYANPKAVDLGCGRGEWLELLKEAGFEAQGVDLDDGMLSACRDIGLEVQTHDAVEFLRGLPDASQVVVSGFHIAEHITFSDLQALVQEAFRVLKPVGLLILETPNPENIVVGTSNFYLDPTHQRPIPPQLLAFLPAYYGFQKIKTLRLQEPAELGYNKAPSLLDVLGGVSPDYAVVAQKGAVPEQMKLFEVAFEKDYGLTLETLALKYEARLASAEARLANAEARSELNEARLEQIRNTWLWRTLQWVNNKIEGMKKVFR
jgi:O-antigen chain-terminating methyltransferase